MVLLSAKSSKSTRTSPIPCQVSKSTEANASMISLYAQTRSKLRPTAPTTTVEIASSAVHLLAFPRLFRIMSPWCRETTSPHTHSLPLYFVAVNPSSTAICSWSNKETSGSRRQCQCTLALIVTGKIRIVWSSAAKTLNLFVLCNNYCASSPQRRQSFIRMFWHLVVALLAPILYYVISCTILSHRFPLESNLTTV